MYLGNVYSITNKKNGKMFIGMGLHTERTIRNHFSNFDSHPLHVDIRKQKPEDFEVKIHFTVWENDEEKARKKLKDVWENLIIRYSTRDENKGYNVYTLENKCPLTRRQRIIEEINRRYKKGNPNKRRVIQMTERGKKIAEYDSITEASNKTGISKAVICECLNGKKKKARYVDVEGNYKFFIFACDNTRTSQK